METKIKSFTKEAIERAKSPTPEFWKTMKPVMGGVFGGLSAVQAALPDTTPRWIEWSIVFVVGAMSYFVGNFGTKNTNLIK